VAIVGQQRDNGRQNLRQRNERDVNCRQIEFAIEFCRAQIAGINSFTHFNARIIPDFPIELVMTDINGDNCSRTVLQKAISETTGRCAHIDADQSGNVDVKFPEGGFEFYSTATDKTPARFFFDSYVCFVKKNFGRFLNQLLVNQNSAGHYQGLRFRARINQTPIDEELIDALALHAQIVA
jgi:hypothetical protein